MWETAKSISLLYRFIMCMLILCTGIISRRGVIAMRIRNGRKTIVIVLIILFLIICLIFRAQNALCKNIYATSAQNIFSTLKLPENIPDKIEITSSSISSEIEPSFKISNNLHLLHKTSILV